eukprot:232570_1
MAQDIGDSNLSLYSQLININEAIEWIENKKTVNNKGDENEMQCIDINCNGDNISNCLSIKRIISMLDFYNNNYLNYSLLNKYLIDSYKFNLILSDYHHILFKHLNCDNKLNILINKQFSEIYSEIVNKN